MKQRWILALMLVVAMYMQAATYGVRDIPNVHVADSTKFVSNPDGILSVAAVQQLNAQLQEIWRTTTTEPVVVVVDNIDSDDIDSYATDLFTYWGLGKKDRDNGLLVLIVKDQQGAVIRPGYGIEGVLPDGLSGRILRNKMFPNFREGDYDTGTIAGVKEISTILTNPEYADELRSQYANNSFGSSEDEDLGALVLGYLSMALIISLVMLLIIYPIYSQGKKNGDTHEAYTKLKKWRIPVLMLVFFGMGVPLITYLPLRKMLNNLRNGKRECKHCHHQMVKMDEDADNAFLNTAQDMEEKLNSVDYDVWVCPECNEVDIIPFDNELSNYTKCPKCGAKACHVTSMRRVVQPTTQREGVGLRTRTCEHCKRTFEEHYTIPRESDPAAAAAAGAILGSMLGSGRGGGFGGGFGGGSFGGGRTGGGGASGHW